MKSLVDQISLSPDCSYAVEAEGMGERSWARVIEGFEDASLMQTWPYGAHRWGTESLSHVVLRKNGLVAAAAQVVIIKIPLLGSGLAYVKGGPLWHPRGKERDRQAFRMLVRTLRETFAARRGLLLRIFPNAVEDGTGDLTRAFQEEGFLLDTNGSGKTVLIDLSYSLDDLWKSLSGKWRLHLRRSEQNGLSVTEGIDDQYFGAFVRLYKEMQARKQRPEIFDIDDYAAIQRDVPAALKMKVLLCEHKGEPVAGVTVSCCEDTALMVFAATSNRALQLLASYFLFWRLIQRLKASGYRWLDLNGISQDTTSGPSRFKAQLAGKLGRFTHYLGHFEACENTMSWCAVKLADRVLETHRRVRARLSDRLRGRIVDLQGRFPPPRGSAAPGR